jgi:hypothetical protein
MRLSLTSNSRDENISKSMEMNFHRPKNRLMSLQKEENLSPSLETTKKRTALEARMKICVGIGNTKNKKRI